MTQIMTHTLEQALATHEWPSLDSLLNYVLARCPAGNKDELGELIYFADIQLKTNSPVRDFL